MTHQIRDLTGNPEVEEAIRKYYINKKMKEVAFVEGVVNKQRERVDFTIDNWYQKSDKIRRKYEEQQAEEYSNTI